MRKIASHYALINGALERGIVVEVDNHGTITDITRHDTIDNLAISPRAQALRASHARLAA